jgi:hypothetical protein
MSDQDNMYIYGDSVYQASKPEYTDDQQNYEAFNDEIEGMNTDHILGNI